MYAGAVSGPSRGGVGCFGGGYCYRSQVIPKRRRIHFNASLFMIYQGKYDLILETESTKSMIQK